MKRPRSATMLAAALAGSLILLGVGLRVLWMNETAMWCDEAESSINALTILQTGVPASAYLGIPIYENTLTEPWEGNEEYEFRDSSYSPQGVTVYHGWLPLYAIAASQAIFGMRPDQPESPPRTLHGVDQIGFRTTVPRIPSIIFALGTLVMIYLVGCKLGGEAAGLGALTLMALNAKTVDFGFQARYYSLTLFMSAVAAWCLIRVVRRGHPRDFVWLGIAEALLFHAHQFSAVVFAVVAVSVLPTIVRQQGWFGKSLLGAGCAAVLVFPWVWLSGFLKTASSVPKVFKLFSSLTDWFVYSLDRPVPLLLVIGLVIVVGLTQWRPRWLPPAMSRPLRSHGAIYAVLLAWMLAAYAAFHVIVPAASFFFERLSLVLWTPFVLLLGLFVSDLLRGLEYRRTLLLAVAAMLAFLLVRSRLALLESTSLSSSREGVAGVIEALSSQAFEPGTKFYATPNEHLTYTYYTGIPVQSVAPVRRSFFDHYPHPIVFIERQMEAYSPEKRDLDTVGLTRNLTSDAMSHREMGNRAWESLVSRDARRRGVPGATPPLSPELQDLINLTEIRALKARADCLRDIKSSPVLRGIPAATIKDVWMGFFYRFVDSGSRIGENLQILPRLANARLILLPQSDAIVFISDQPVE